MPDTVCLHALALVVTIGPDAWDRLRPQPVRLSLDVHTPLARAGATDDVAASIHYGHLAAAVLALQQREFPDLWRLAQAAADAALGPRFAAVDAVRVVADAPKLLLRAQGLAVEITRTRSAHAPPDRLHIKDLTLPIIIGVNPPEREHKQLVITNLVFVDPASPFPHRHIADSITEHIESTSYLTLEAFATSVARRACSLDGIDLVTVRAQKPSAVSLAHSSAVEITRDAAFFSQDYTVT